MLAEYTGVLVILVGAMVLAGAAIALQRRLGPREGGRADSERAPVAAHLRVGPRTCTAALLFLLMNVQVVFFHPWGAVFADLGWGGLATIGVFSLPLGVGLLYAWNRGAFDW